MSTKSKSGPIPPVRESPAKDAKHARGVNGDHLQAPSPTFDGRPMSPMRISRIDEKNALAGLNNRFAAIIDRNKFLERENSNLGQELKKSEANYTLTIDVMKNTFDKDIGDIRKKFQDAEKDKVKLSMSEAQLKKDLQDAQAKVLAKTKDADDLAKKLSLSESAVIKLQADGKNAAEEKAKFLKDKKDADDAAAKIAKELADLKKKLELDALLKVELENALRVKQEELQTKSQIHEQEVSVMRSMSKKEIQEVDGRLQKEYMDKLSDAIKDLRAECSAQMIANKEEQEILYSKMEGDVRGEADRAKESLTLRTSELKTLHLDLDGIKKKLALLEGEKHTMLQNIKDLEGHSTREREASAADKLKLQELLAQMMKERKVLIAEYHDLMDEKVALDNEIATYRKLLEGEEERLSIIVNTGPAKKGQFLQNLIGHNTKL